jgi:hypothetical protein
VPATSEVDPGPVLGDVDGHREAGHPGQHAGCRLLGRKKPAQLGQSVAGEQVVEGHAAAVVVEADVVAPQEAGGTNGVNGQRHRGEVRRPTQRAAEGMFRVATFEETIDDQGVECSH